MKVVNSDEDRDKMLGKKIPLKIRDRKSPEVFGTRNLTKKNFSFPSHHDRTLGFYSVCEWFIFNLVKILIIKRNLTEIEIIYAGTCQYALLLQISMP